MSLTKRFKNSRFSKWFQRTFKKQDDDLTAHEIGLLFLAFLLLAPIIASQGWKKDKK
jgi:hypothetical protein